jgi:hypothetical protein
MSLSPIQLVRSENVPLHVLALALVVLVLAALVSPLRGPS